MQQSNRILPRSLARLSVLLLLLLASSSVLNAVPTRIAEVPVTGTIEMGLAPFVERAINEAAETGADAVLIRVDTFGGRVDAAVRIRDAIRDCQLPCVVWIEGRAISAGALISLAADTLVMMKGASIGAAQPVQISPGGKSEATGEKTVSYMRGEMRATAEMTGRDPRIAEAMVDAGIAIDGISEEGKLLTLTAQEAVSLGMADFIVGSRQELLSGLGWETATLSPLEPTWSELMVRFLTHPVLAGLLLSLGGLGLLLELRTPGVGLPGLVGVIALALYFGSHYLVHLAGNVEIFLFLGGLILIILELFVIPGFGAAGILGAILLIAGLFLSRLAPHGGPADINGALVFLLLSLAATALLFFALLRFLPEARWASGFVLAQAQDPSKGYHADQHLELDLCGREGICLTDLRPAGTIEIDGKRIDVVTEGDYIDANTPVRVTDVHGNRVVVEAMPNADNS